MTSGGGEGVVRDWTREMSDQKIQATKHRAAAEIRSKIRLVPVVKSQMHTECTNKYINCENKGVIKM